MINEIKARIDKMIELYNLVVVDDKVGTYTAQKSLAANTNDWDFLKENKADFIIRIPQREAEIKAERKTREAATVRFRTTGWESHEAIVDTREDLEEQFKNIAARYPNDCTAESVKADYEKHINKTAEKAAVKAEANNTEAVRVEQIKATAASTGEKQVIRRYMDECNDPNEECNVDNVTVWAMPDGTETVTRQHNW